MANKKQEKTKEPVTISDDDKTVINQAITEGRALIDQGSSKIDAAMAIYRILKDHPQQLIIQAFIEGATLTEKGALTYWYNCRRKISCEKLSSRGNG